MPVVPYLYIRFHLFGPVPAQASAETVANSYQWPLGPVRFLPHTPEASTGYASNFPSMPKDLWYPYTSHEMAIIVDEAVEVRTFVGVTLS